MIRLSDVVFRWRPTDPPTLDIPSFDVADGEKVFLEGPSGFGKTTLLNLLGGVAVPEAGQVLVAGQDLAQLPGAARDRFRADHIGFIFQMFNLVPYLSVADNVALPCRFSAERLRRASARDGGLAGEGKRLLSAMGLDPDALGDRPVSALSVGQQQRVAAARALIGAPGLVIADEPTSASTPTPGRPFSTFCSGRSRRSAPPWCSSATTVRSPARSTGRSRLPTSTERGPKTRRRRHERADHPPSGDQEPPEPAADRRADGLRHRRVRLSRARGGESPGRGTGELRRHHLWHGPDRRRAERGGQLLLYSVFRIGNATNTVSWRSYLDLAKREDIAWTIPMSLGDSHKGFRVLGTTTAYFDHFRYGRRTPLEIEIGKRFDDVFDAVLGAEVARTLGYTLGQSITISHGIGSGGLVGHDDKPFTVVGILERTGTPVDRTVHVSLEGIEAIHVDWRKGAKVPGMTITADEVREMDLTPATITAVLVGLKSRLAICRAQREISRYRREPLSAILPGVALEELWGLTRVAETALGIISVFVVAAGLLGMMTMVFASLGERRREMAILRSVGARPGHVLGLFVAESAALTVAGAAFGVALLYGRSWRGARSWRRSSACSCRCPRRARPT